MIALAHDEFGYPLPEGHRFPLGRYAMLRRRLEDVPGVRIRTARAATDDELLLGHTGAYLARVVAGRLDARERAALGLPWSPEHRVAAEREPVALGQRIPELVVRERDHRASP